MSYWQLLVSSALVVFCFLPSFDFCVRDVVGLKFEGEVFILLPLLLLVADSLGAYVYIPGVCKYVMIFYERFV